MNLLLLSNSRGPDGAYLTHALDAVKELLDTADAARTTGTEPKRAIFIPFAGVTMTWASYTESVAAALAPAGLDVIDIDTVGDVAAQHAAVRSADAIIVGGGNTFQLLGTCRARGLLEVIAETVRAGTPYIGWSAGANLACPTISTTNDMPIVDPRGFSALDLINFQINPHYTNATPEGHRGETRNQRIAEFLVANPHSWVLGLPEGDWLRVRGTDVTLHGPFEAIRFLPGQEPVAIAAGAVSAF
jgi:dipeptidase E